MLRFEKNNNFVGFEVLTAVVIKSFDFQRTTRRYIPEDRTRK
jgi:hypothetical protein